MGAGLTPMAEEPRYTLKLPVIKEDPPFEEFHLGVFEDRRIPGKRNWISVLIPPRLVSDEIQRAWKHGIHNLPPGSIKFSRFAALARRAGLPAKRDDIRAEHHETIRRILEQLSKNRT